MTAVATEGRGRGSDPGQVRASGLTAGQEAAEEHAEALGEPLDDQVLPEERDRSLAGLNFSRLRTDWATSADRATMAEIKAVVDGEVRRRFADAYDVMYELWDVVREHDVDEETGVTRVDRYGLPEWRRSPTGAYLEDWSRLATRQREDFLFRLVTQLFLWEQEAADVWGESMFAKALWQQRFAAGFDGPARATDKSREAAATLASEEDKFFAVYLAYLSKRCEAVVGSLRRLEQRLKDSLPR